MKQRTLNIMDTLNETISAFDKAKNKQFTTVKVKIVTSYL